MKTYEDLEKDIREKLPELLGISKGCYILDNIDNTRYLISTCSNYHFTAYDKNDNRIRSTYKVFANEEFSVIGHEIQLHHVLKYVKKTLDKKKPKSFSSSDFTLCIDYDLSVYDFTTIIYSTWNPDKPLQDQPEEMKNYLTGLL